MNASKTEKKSRTLLFPILVTVLALIVGAVGVILFMAPETPESPKPKPPPTREKLVLEQADDLLKTGRVPLAAQLLGKFLQDEPQNVKLRLKLADVFLFGGEEVFGNKSMDLASRQIQIVLTKNPNHPQALWKKGGLMELSGKSGEEFFRRAAEQPQAGAEIWGRYGIQLLMREQRILARKYLDQSAEAGTKQAEVFLALAQFQVEEKNFDRAEEYVQQAIQRDPRDWRTWSFLAEIQKNRGKPAQAKEALLKALDRVPSAQQGPLQMQLGRIQMAAGDWDSAAETFTRAARYPSHRLEALLTSAQCYYLRDKYAQAMKRIDEAWELDPGNPQVAKWKKKIEDARFGPRSVAPKDKTPAGKTPAAPASRLP